MSSERLTIRPGQSLPVSFGENGATVSVSGAAVAYSGGQVSSGSSAVLYGSDVLSVDSSGSATAVVFITPLALSPGIGVAKYSLTRDFGAAGDGVLVEDGAMNGSNAVLTSASASFRPQDVGKAILVVGAGASGGHLKTTITSRQSATQVTLAAVSATAVSNAVVVYGTDDTAAVQAAVTQMHSDVTALCDVPDGIYVLASNVTAGTGVSAQILFPATPSNGSGRSTGFVGRSVPFGVAESVNLAGGVQRNGATFVSLLTSPSGTRPSVFAQDKNGSGYGQSKCINIFDGVTVLVPPSSAISGINLDWSGGMDVGVRLGVKIGTLSSPQNTTAPPAFATTAAVGLISSAPGNWARVRIGNVDIHGFTIGFKPTEHLHADNVNISYCQVAVLVPETYLGARINRLSTFDCPHHIASEATSKPLPLNIGQWALEDNLGTVANPSWVVPISHLNTALVAGALLQGSVEDLIHVNEGVGNGPYPLARVPGSGRIDFRVGRQYINTGGSPYVRELPILRLTRAAAQSIPNNAVTAVSWDTERQDEFGWHDPAVNPSRITPDQAGVYLVTAQAVFLANATGVRYLYIYRNGTEIRGFAGPVAVTAADAPVMAAAMVRLAVGDYIEIKAFQNSGGALNLVKGAEYSPEVQVALLGA